MIPLGIPNSSPFIALGRIGRLDLIQGQFQRLVLPQAVAEELGETPEWAIVETAADARLLADFPPRIHAGEAEVILLGIQRPGAILVLDDWYAREFARARGLTVIGTIGILLRAKQSGAIVSVAPMLEQLAQAGFRVSPSIIQEAKRLAGE